MEEQDIGRFRKELWTLGAKEREKRGRCFADMVLDLSFEAPRTQEPVNPNAAFRIHQHTYKFVRRDARLDGDQASFLNGFINVGDAVTVSVEPYLLALTRGFVIELTPKSVVLGVDHNIQEADLRSRIRAMSKGPGKNSTSDTNDDLVFRLDKDELFGGMSRVRENLAHLFFADGDIQRLRLVVDLAPPRFDGSVELPSCPRLNPNQVRAVHKVLQAQDYALILGMPGTGKTTVIVELIRKLVEMGKSVLVTSYTHSAVDTILAKLTDDKFGVLRLGNIDKVHPSVRKFTLKARRVASNIEQLEQQLMTPPVIATTCLSLDQYA